jgi:hypothetical protein
MMTRDERNAAISVAAVLVLTSIHHAYGAVVYATPWRHHATHVSAVTLAVLAAALLVGTRWRHTMAGAVARWTFVAVAAAVAVAAIGIYEGGYNHVAKNALYFGGTPDAVMQRLFPPPTYEMPNDVFFEATGILQFPLALIAARHLRSLVRGRPRERRAPAVPVENRP